MYESEHIEQISNIKLIPTYLDHFLLNSIQIQYIQVRT